jgi:5-formyltetrahydrofolate cyclo-ligase
MNPKYKWRQDLIEKRLNIDSYRRLEARDKSLEVLRPILDSFRYVLSFASKEEEIDLWPLNRWLAEEKKLVLPKVIRGALTPFLISNLETDLEEGSRWKIKEPIVDKCCCFDPKNLECVLVPGLGFDRNHHRIGYGMGYFDQFLVSISCPSYGIGFKEQLTEDSLPVEAHDIGLTRTFLF